ncbi:helicase-related protein [Microbulbifer thermotolerans]|uniref:helicase-related protein n=1 Tax=Microbulbifer thermotolerans TaxID=252514 RepID=UPI00224B405E|nr:DEAD/DEAH box helicase [Microbulbifer thermotolerans]MCX2780434.1 DEAD/DEAH box helicase [Microbulbifer thermotolerans]MCX2805894.1 DEAD/DEAH box helicase [Microbulbifer thermotolerans]
MTFSTTTKLLPHQKAAVAKLLPTRVGALFMDMGTGKSRTLLELAYLRREKWDRLFWFTPCALRDNVREQILLHTTLTAEDVAVWEQRALTRGIDERCWVHVVGIETMSSSDRAVLAYNRLVTENSFVAVDESSYIKSPRAKRSQRITHMSARARYRTVLTGTPFTQGAVDLFSQMQFLSPKILGYRSFYSFARNHLEFEERRDAYGNSRRTGRIVRTHNEEYLAARIAPYVYQVRKDECLDLPGKLYEERVTSMTHSQGELYEQAKEEVLQLDYDDWSSIAIFHLFTSLQTIVCGFWRRPDGRVIEVDHNRIELLLATLAEIPDNERVIIWAKYQYALNQICEALKQEYGADQVCPYHGRQSDTERNAQLRRWRSGARFLVATQGVGGHGLTLTESSYVIFYADSFKYAERIQAEDRCHRIGQTRRPVYISLRCSPSIDDRISSALYRKGDALQEFQKQVDEYRVHRMKKKAIELVNSL